MYQILEGFNLFLAIFFAYQCLRFAWSGGRDWFRGNNGITQGLTIFYIALVLGAILSAIDAAINGLDHIYGPFSVITLTSDNFQPSLYNFASRAARFAVVVLAIVGNHKLWFALREAD